MARRNRREPDFLDVERFAYRRLREDWRALQDSAAEREVEAPDFFKVLAEAQETVNDWDRDADSYIRSYLNQRSWGRDEEWTKHAQASSSP